MIRHTLILTLYSGFTSGHIGRTKCDAGTQTKIACMQANVLPAMPSLGL